MCLRIFFLQTSGICLSCPLAPKSGYSLSFLFTISLLNHTFRSKEWRKWSPIGETLNCETKSPCKLLRKCIENSMENMHTDVTVKKVKHKENKVFIDSNSLCTSLYRLTLFTKRWNSKRNYSEWFSKSF